MNRLEYWLATAMLRWLRVVFSVLPIRQDRVVLASARHRNLEGNLRSLYHTMSAARPDLDYVLLLEPYSYRFLGKLIYLLRLTRGMYYLCTSRLFIIDNAYFPVHVAPHRRGTTVVQVWHAAGALKRFGVDTRVPLREPERSFLHRHYDFVVASSEQTRAAYAAALRTPVERVIALGSPRTDLVADTDGVQRARSRVLRRYPTLDGRKVVLYAPTFRGRGERKRSPRGLDAPRLRGLLPGDYALVLKTHPNLHRRPDHTEGFDVVIDPAMEITEVLAATDVLVTDYSSVVFDWALFRRPLVLLVDDLAEYENNPGLYIDYRNDMIGTQVSDSDGVAAAILAGGYDAARWDAFIDRHLGSSRGGASDRFVERFVASLDSQVGRGGEHVHHE
ncbi:MAG TPA: CDP-glycerol glycerophosphotransferase family protein [Patescibacteria group bacterium]|nr:CDP-glycerol glycerophosphotransferase family protein [Patescibacteria group bacterium]